MKQLTRQAAMAGTQHLPNQQPWFISTHNRQVACQYLSGLQRVLHLKVLHAAFCRGSSVLLLGTGAVAVATVATLFPPPVSVWLPIAGVVAAIGLLAGFAQWVLAQIQGGSNPSGSLNPSQVLELVKKRRSVFPKDMTGGCWVRTSRQQCSSACAALQEA
jgi:hypothetical protein